MKTINIILVLALLALTLAACEPPTPTPATSLEDTIDQIPPIPTCSRNDCIQPIPTGWPHE